MAHHARRTSTLTAMATSNHSRFADAGAVRPRKVPRLEADRCRRRARPQPEIALLRGHEHRVGDEAVLVLSRRLPLGEAHRAEEDRLAGSIPVEVVVEGAQSRPVCSRP